MCNSNNNTTIPLKHRPETPETLVQQRIYALQSNDREEKTHNSSPSKNSNFHHEIPIFPGLLHPAGNFDGTSVTGETGSTGSTPKARSTDSVGTGVGSTT